MKKKTALHMMFGILGLLLVFHFLIISGIIPFDKAWAGRLKSVEEMRKFESFSIALNAFMIFILSIKYKQLKKGIQNKVVNFFIWCFTAFFTLNTFGNLFAKDILELIFGTAVTLASAILCFIIVKKDKSAPTL